MGADEASRLIAVRDRTGVLIQEAFMIREHPQWARAIEIVRAGRLGDIQAVVADFSYHNVDPANVRNIAAAGGGGLMDIGCYLIHAARWIFNREPSRVACLMEIDPVFGTDRRTSMTFDFDGAHAVLTCGTQGVPHQRVTVFGASGRLEIEIPFNAPPDRACRMFVDDGLDPTGGSVETIEVDVCDQYTRQGDAVSRAIRAGRPAPYPLEDSLANMRALDAAREAARLGRWATLGPWNPGTLGP
jgi:predicted dehydrogenase